MIESISIQILVERFQKKFNIPYDELLTFVVAVLSLHDLSNKEVQK